MIYQNTDSFISYHLIMGIVYDVVVDLSPLSVSHSDSMDCGRYISTFKAKSQAIKYFNSRIAMGPWRKVATKYWDQWDTLIRKVTMRYIYDSYSISLIQRLEC